MLFGPKKRLRCKITRPSFESLVSKGFQQYGCGSETCFFTQNRFVGFFQKDFITLHYILLNVKIARRFELSVKINLIIVSSFGVKISTFAPEFNKPTLTDPRNAL